MKNDLDFNTDTVTPIDLNWSRLMEIAVRVSSFENSTSNPNRFLKDFILVVKAHNFRWLPEAPIYSLSIENNNAIKRRITSSVEELTKKTDISKLNNRLGLYFPKPWANELLLSVNKQGNLMSVIYPGNTKGQGRHIFDKDPKFANTINIMGNDYPVGITKHIKFTSFQSYFTGLWFNNEVLKKELFTKDNFRRYTGRKKRDIDWTDIEACFDDCFKTEYDWKTKCDWYNKIINSGKTQFDLSFGYYVEIQIPFKVLQNIDTDKNDLTGLTTLLYEIYDAYQNKLFL